MVYLSDGEGFTLSRQGPSNDASKIPEDTSSEIGSNDGSLFWKNIIQTSLYTIHNSKKWHIWAHDKTIVYYLGSVAFAGLSFWYNSEAGMEIKYMLYRAFRVQ